MAGSNLTTRRLRREERDQRRGYAVDKKRVIIAYAVEAVIIAASLVGAWLFAKMYGHNDSTQIEMMMLAPIGYAVIEFCRVPLAISARAHVSVFVRTIAIIGVICASGVTVKSMSQLGQIMFAPRLFDVTQRKEELEEAQAKQKTINQQIADADALVSDRRKALESLEESLKTDNATLGNLPKSQCAPTTWYSGSGRVHRGQTCKDDPRIAALSNNLKTTLAARNEAAGLVEKAQAARQSLNRDAIDHEVAAADTNYREAVLHSQLHSFAAMLFGVDPIDVTDAQIHKFLRIFVFFPAIFVAFASSFIAFTAVNHIRPELIPFEPEGPDFVLNPIYEAVLHDAVERVTQKHEADATKIGELV